MTVTPDQANHLVQRATGGPWYVHTDPDDPDGTYIYNDPGHMCVAIEPLGSDYRPADLDLIAAAPDLAQTIAGMRWEWGVRFPDASEWWPGGDSEKTVCAAKLARHVRFICRLVSAPVVIGE